MMKKAYAKPMLYAESFALVEHIAQTCAWVTTFGTGCPLADGPVVFFTETPGCNEDGISMITFAGYDPSEVTMEQLINNIHPTCYNSFSEYSQLYTS